MSKLHYFAYGSNLHPVRLQHRVPSAEFKGLIGVPGYSLRFHKLHQEDRSGKCNMLLTDQPEDVVYGALYEMKASEKPLLDRCEGVGYRCDLLNLTFQAHDVECFVYIAEHSHINDDLKPYRWYHDIVLLGAVHHQMPEDYIERIRSVIPHEDPDLDRQANNQRLVEEMREFTSRAR